MCNFVSKRWKEEKEKKKLAYLEFEKNKDKKETKAKFCSFLRNSLVPRSHSYKFDKSFVLNNDKWNYLKSRVSIFVPKWITHNEEVSFCLYYLYFSLRFGYIILNEEEDIELQKESRDSLCFVFDFSVIYYFFNNYLYEFYIYNKNFRSLIYSYYLNLTYNDSYFDLYNYYLYPFTSFFFILLNIGLIKLEHDKALVASNKWYKIPLMDLNFFDYSEFTEEVYAQSKEVEEAARRLIHYYPDDPEDPWPRKRWYKYVWLDDINPNDWEMYVEDDKAKLECDTVFNISDDSLLNYQDNIFISFCIYEFYLDFKYYFSNIFNSDFFYLSSLKEYNKNKVYKNKTYLSNISYNDLLEDKKSKKEYYSEKFQKGYNELSLILLRSNINKLDYYNFMMSIRSFMIKIPYLFFLLYTYYTIYYRNARYNLYIRSFFFFEEYTSKKTFFILHNNPVGKNKNKMFYLKFQKLWILSHLKFYLEERFFNKWFLFYSTRCYHLSVLLKNDALHTNYCFNNILNNNNFNLLLKVNELEKGFNSKSFFFIYEFYYDNLLDFWDMKLLRDGWSFMMSVRQCKFLRRFKLGASNYIRLKEIHNFMYTLPYDIKFFYESINELLSFDLMLDLYNTKFLDYYFLKDLYNFNDQINLRKNFKIVNFYNKLKYLAFYIIDPYFVKFFLRKYFPKRLKKLWRLKAFYRRYIIQSRVGKKFSINRTKIFNYDYFHHYFNWRTDTSTNVQQNYYFKDLISSSFSISDMIAKSRYLNLLDRLQFILNLNNIYNMQKIQRFILLMKDFYFQLLNESIDAILYMFFLDVKKIINLQNNTNIWSYMSNIIDYTFLYRSYVCSLLFEFNYYIDWFNNRSKRVLWIYHKKDYREHEGILFYKDRYNEIF